MIKKVLLALLLTVLILAGFAIWRFMMPNTNFDQGSKFLYIKTGNANKAAVMKILVDSNFIKNPGSFEVLAGKMDVWNRLNPGRYELKKGMSLTALARMLRNGAQSPVNLVITKLRTKEQFASLVGRRLEPDSLKMINYLNNEDSLQQYGLDSSTVMTSVFPDTYSYFWNSNPSDVFKKLNGQYKKIWTDDRKLRAEQRGLNPQTAYILASIIEEETNVHDEKDTMASVYLNRLKSKMRLGADPTVKFALRDFDLRRIYEKHLAVESPYNTYRYAGLPPGPICTPSLKTLDAVLRAPATKYLYFVAKSDFSARHVFTENYNDHLKYAREYQRALTDLQKRKQQKAEEDTGK